MLCNMSYWALKLHGFVATRPSFPYKSAHGFNANLMENWNRLHGFLSVLVSLQITASLGHTFASKLLSLFDRVGVHA